MTGEHGTDERDNAGVPDNADVPGRTIRRQLLLPAAAAIVIALAVGAITTRGGSDDEAEEEADSAGFVVPSEDDRCVDTYLPAFYAALEAGHEEPILLQLGGETDDGQFVLRLFSQYLARRYEVGEVRANVEATDDILRRCDIDVPSRPNKGESILQPTDDTAGSAPSVPPTTTTAPDDGEEPPAGDGRSSYTIGENGNPASGFAFDGDVAGYLAAAAPALSSLAWGEGAEDAPLSYTCDHPDRTDLDFDVVVTCTINGPSTFEIRIERAMTGGFVNWELTRYVASE